MFIYDSFVDPPPEDEPFLALVDGVFEKVKWLPKHYEYGGFFAFSSPCACYQGTCFAEFRYWTPLPKTEAHPPPQFAAALDNVLKKGPTIKHEN